MARPGIEPKSSRSASQELKHYTTAVPHINMATATKKQGPESINPAILPVSSNKLVMVKFNRHTKRCSSDRYRRKIGVYPGTKQICRSQLSPWSEVQEDINMEVILIIRIID